MQSKSTILFSERGTFIFALLVFAFSFGFLFYRTYFGVDFFDEPFYSALSVRLFTGQKIFVNELNLGQTFSVFTYPSFKVHWIFKQSMEGLILFQRHTFVVLVLGLSLFIYLTMQNSIGRPAALLISIACGLFFPGNMLTLGYNTLGTLFLTAGLVSLHLGLYRNHRFSTILSGVFLGLASIAYITLSAFSILVFISLFFCSKNKRDSLDFGIGFVLIISYPFYFVLTHFSDFLTALAFRKEYFYEAPTFTKVLVTIHKFFPKWVLLISSLFAALVFKTRSRSPAFNYYLLGIAPLMALLLSRLSWGNWNLYPFYISLLGLTAFPALRAQSEVISLFKWVYLPSVVAGFVTSLTSGCGHINSQVGLLPAVIASLIFLFQGMVKLKPHRTALPLFSLGIIPFLTLLFPLNIWSDAPFKELTEKVEMGPYKGIYTTPQKKRVIEKVYMELNPLLAKRGPLLVYPNFPSIYLFSPVPPAKGVTWYQNSGRTNEILAKLYKDQINPESRVVRMKIGQGAPIENPTKVFDPADPLNHLIESTHTPVKDTEWYTLFAPKKELFNPKS